MNEPIRVAVTGAAGNIGYSLLFRLAAGDAFGPDQPIILQLLEIPPAMSALEGVAMELDDCAFPLLKGMELTDEPAEAFDGANWALLVGAKPRGKGQERNDLIHENGPIFVAQGEALNQNAADDIRVLVVGNPANTNCLIAMSNAPDIPSERFTAMTRLDYNRATNQLAKKAGVQVTDVSRVVIWGNHSATQVPDITHAWVKSERATEIVDEAWIKNEFIPTVQQRGAAIIKARGQSSAASAANAALDHVRSWALGTSGDDWVSMSVSTELAGYDVPDGLIFSFPVTCSNGDWDVVEGLEHEPYIQEMLDATAQELQEEREVVKDLL